jgi:hypothetical protein
MDASRLRVPVLATLIGGLRLAMTDASLAQAFRCRMVVGWYLQRK